MSDYSEHLTEMAKAQGELCWLLPEGRWQKAMEKALLIEQAARALVEECKRKDHKRELEQIARNNPHAQVLTDAVGTDKPKASPIIYAHINRYVGRN